MNIQAHSAIKNVPEIVKHILVDLKVDNIL